MLVDNTMVQKDHKENTLFDKVFSWLRNRPAFVIIAFVVMGLTVIVNVKKSIIELLPGKTESTIVVNDNGKKEFTYMGEKVVFTDLLRTVQIDVVKIQAETQSAGVKAEYAWIKHEYPHFESYAQAHVVYLDNDKYVIISSLNWPLEDIIPSKNIDNGELNIDRVIRLFDILLIRKNRDRKVIWFDITEFAHPYRFVDEVWHKSIEKDEVMSYKIDQLYKTTDER